MDRSTTDSCAGVSKSDCKAVDRSHVVSRLAFMGAIIWWRIFKYLQENMDTATATATAQSSSDGSGSALIQSENPTTQCHNKQPTEKRMQLIGPDNFADEVVSSSMPVLLLYMTHDDDFPNQHKLIGDIAVRYGARIKTGLLQESFSEYFRSMLNLQGTPTFLIFLNGKEKNRMLGLADFQSLDDFIRETLNHALNHTAAPQQRN